MKFKEGDQVIVPNKCIIQGNRAKSVPVQGTFLCFLDDHNCLVLDDMGHIHRCQLSEVRPAIKY